MIVNLNKSSTNYSSFFENLIRWQSTYNEKPINNQALLFKKQQKTSWKGRKYAVQKLAMVNM